jgi:hypothetical protein
VKGPAKLAAVAVGALLISALVVRNAAVADRERYPALAASLWPGHPAILTDTLLLDIAHAAVLGRPAPISTRVAVERLATRAPLSPDPFVIEGAIAETRGLEAKAEQLLEEARAHDPRSRGARFLLADRYFRTGRVTDGLVEMYALINLQSRGGDPFVPALVAYAKSPGAVPQLRAFFKEHPRLEPSVLDALSTDARNADIVLALATNLRDPKPDWRPGLLTALVNGGQFEKAYVIWRRLSLAKPAQRLFNPSFAASDAPAPFNWQLMQGNDGVAEPDSRGGLNLLYYGRANAVLATQMTLLGPGRYRLSMNVESDEDPSAVHWQIHCLPASTSIADLPLRQRGTSIEFEVPIGCRAQKFELAGIAGDTPETTELTIRELRLGPEASE